MAESKIGDMNYYQVSGWMLNRLGLKGTALQIYAIIYGFSQDGESSFTGSLQYLCDFTNTSRPTVIKALKELVDGGYLVKEEGKVNGVSFNTYKVSLQAVKNLYQGSQETLQGVVKILDRGSKETLPGGSQETLQGVVKKLDPIINIYNKSSDNKEDIEEDPENPKYGEFKNVILTAEEMDKLKSKFPKDWDKRIERLSEYMASTGKKYKSHLATIQAWARREEEEAKKKTKETPANQDYGRPEDFYS